METPSEVGNYFLNSLACSVRQNLIGVARANKNVQIMDNVDAIVRKDIRELVRDNKVLIVTGAGAGHEPMGIGYVGPYLLSASISGSYFASPSSGQVIKLVEQIADFETPVLLIIGNYTGDRLNFGLAKEYLALKNYKNVRLFVINDDFTPLYTGNTQGLDVEQQRRGLTGKVFIDKVAGVLSELGTSIHDIERCLNRLKKLIFTFSVSSSACDLPGHGASFHIEPGQMELGLGLHGESGVRRLQLCSAQQTVDLILAKMIDYLKNNSILADYNNRVAVIVNNLCSMTQIEMNVINLEVIQQLTTKHGITVERFYSGPFATSFNMKGFSISLMMVDDETLGLLDMGPPSLPCVTNACINHDYVFTSDKNNNKTTEASLDQHLYDSLLSLSQYKLILQNICSTLIEKEQYLNRLDGTVGDSDCGSTIKAIARLIETETLISESSASFGKLARLVSESIGGSSGALYSLLFTAASNFINANKVPAVQDSMKNKIIFWHNLMEHSIDTISMYSGAKPDDRSMIDGLHGIRLGLADCARREGSLSLEQVAHLVSESTWAQANRTATMKAKVGRASYVNETLITEPDAGAMAVAMWVQSIAHTIAQTN